MLLMEEKGIRGGICHSVYQYAKVKWELNNLCLDNVAKASSK